MQNRPSGHPGGSCFAQAKRDGLERPAAGPLKPYTAHHGGAATAWCEQPQLDFEHAALRQAEREGRGVGCGASERREGLAAECIDTCCMAHEQLDDAAAEVCIEVQGAPDGFVVAASKKDVACRALGGDADEALPAREIALHMRCKADVDVACAVAPKACCDAWCGGA